MPKFNNFIEDLERVKLYIDNDLEKYAAELSTTPEQLQTTYARCKKIADSLGIVELKMLWYLSEYWGGKKTGVHRLLKFLKTRYEKQEIIYVPEFIQAICPPMRLSENLKALRIKNGLTQQTVCTILKIKQSTFFGNKSPCSAFVVLPLPISNFPFFVFKPFFNNSSKLQFVARDSLRCP